MVKPPSSDHRSEWVGAKVRLVDLTGTVGETHRLELGMFESLQSGRLGGFRLKHWLQSLRYPRSMDP